ncbi:hypothetical protein Mal35_55400 [Gimesia maris]|uniref:hypothetical protein n=1 Tax=Gimesia maris TaxID=122 RepID=UPI0011885B81|nr:hypothetical protein [Gimesia maris]QDT82049.1 hypothetical protein Mal35_55400 [Gimesia maris]
MSSTNLLSLKPYCDELTQFVSSPAFLSGETSEESQAFDLGKCNVSWRVVDPVEFIKCINSSDEESPRQCFEEQILGEISGISTVIYGYCNCNPSIYEIIWPVDELIQKQIINSSRTKALAQDISNNPIGNVDYKTAIDSIFHCISHHLGVILNARMLTRSKRYAPLEVLFHAYCAGLFPFGWESETNTILCLHPSSANRNN